MALCRQRIDDASILQGKLIVLGFKTSASPSHEKTTAAMGKKKKKAKKKCCEKYVKKGKCCGKCPLASKIQSKIEKASS